MGSKSQGTHRNDFHTTLPAELLVSIPCGPSLAPLLRLCKCCATGSPECHTVRHCTKDLVLSMPHPWRCPRPGWMGQPELVWDNGRGWSLVIFPVPSSLSLTMIPRSFQERRKDRVNDTHVFSDRSCKWSVAIDWHDAIPRRGVAE